MRRSFGFVWLAVSIVFLAVGCKKSSTEAKKDNEGSAAESAKSASGAKTAARIHWLGKKRLGAEANAANFMRIWNMPESQKLEAQTLDRLSLALWREIGLTNASATNASKLLRGLLDDLVQEESYLEIRNVTNQPGALVLAIKLDGQQAEKWGTNLASVLESLTGATPGPIGGGQRGWRIVATNHPLLNGSSIELSRAGDWTVVGLGRAEKNSAASELAERIKRDGAPVEPQPTNFWIDAEIDLRRISTALSLGWRLPSDFPRILLAVTGDGENVRTRGEFQFSDALPFVLEPWKVPTNTIREPLISFTAAQEIGRLLRKTGPFSLLHTNVLPTQAYEWGLGAMPFQEFAAFKVNDATNLLKELGPQIIEWGNARIPTNCGSIVMTTNSSLMWTGLMAFTTPYLAPIEEAGEQYVLAGILPIPPQQQTAPAELLTQIIGRTNLVYYNWEFTQEKLKQWRFLDDTIFIFFAPSHRPQLRGDMASIRWFQSCATNLNNTATEVTLADARTLKFLRKSQIGLTALELALMARWLESPEFPKYAAPDVWSRAKAKNLSGAVRTNAAPASGP